MKKLFVVLLLTLLGFSQAQAENEQKTITVKNSTDKLIRLTIKYKNCEGFKRNSEYVTSLSPSKTEHIPRNKNCKPKELSAQILIADKFGQKRINDIQIIPKSDTVSAITPTQKLNLENIARDLSFEALKISPESNVSASVSASPPRDSYVLQEL